MITFKLKKQLSIVYFIKNILNMKAFKLDNEPKIESGFKTPDNYFENFQSAMIEKLSKEPVIKETKVISIFRKRKNILCNTNY